MKLDSVEDSFANVTSSTVTTAVLSPGSSIGNDKRIVETVTAAVDQQSIPPSTPTPVKRSRSPATPAEMRLGAIRAALSGSLPASSNSPRASPTPEGRDLRTHHFGVTQTNWQEDPELAPFLSFPALENIAMGHDIKGFVCVNCNHYNRVKEEKDEVEEWGLE